MSNREPRLDRSGFLVVVALAAGPLAGLGLARFAYALILPSMRSDLHWSYSVAATLNTSNAGGYLLGALFATQLGRKFGYRRVFVIGMIAVAAGLLATAATSSVPVLIALRAIVGIGGAVTFVVGAGLAARAGAVHGQGRATMLLAIYFAGSGAGIVVSGLAVPLILSAEPLTTGWRLSWLTLGFAAVLATAVVIPLVTRAEEPDPGLRVAKRWPAGRLAPLLVAYFLYGLGYIAYTTFIIAFITMRGASSAEVRVFWVVLGISSVAAAFFWTLIIGKSRGGAGTALVLLLVAIGAALPLLSTSVWAVFASAVVFGGSFLSVVTSVTAVSRAVLEPRHWAPAIAALTVAFALGQCVGPLLSGIISDGPAGLSTGLAVSAAILALASLCALGQRRQQIRTLSYSSTGGSLHDPE